MPINGQLNHIHGHHKTNQFHMQQDFLFSSKNIFCQCSQILIIVEVLTMKNIKTKKGTPKSMLRWEFASV